MLLRKSHLGRLGFGAGGNDGLRGLPVETPKKKLQGDY